MKIPGPHPPNAGGIVAGIKAERVDSRVLRANPLRGQIEHGAPRYRIEGSPLPGPSSHQPGHRVPGRPPLSLSTMNNDTVKDLETQPMQSSVASERDATGKRQALHGRSPNSVGINADFFISGNLLSIFYTLGILSTAILRPQMHR